MGTNFYWRIGAGGLLPTGEVVGDVLETGDPAWHLGRRSAAGKYCWDCGVTLCVQGAAGVHQHDGGWYVRCPRCGAEPQAQETGGAMLELFGRSHEGRPRGVQGCSSFSWAQDPERAGVLCRQRPDEALIEDEYGEAYTGAAFLAMLLDNCPIQFTDSVGRWFT